MDCLPVLPDDEVIVRIGRDANEPGGITQPLLNILPMVYDIKEATGQAIRNLYNIAVAEMEGRWKDYLKSVSDLKNLVVFIRKEHEGLGEYVNRRVMRIIGDTMRKCGLFIVNYFVGWAWRNKHLNKIFSELLETCDVHDIAESGHWICGADSEITGALYFWETEDIGQIHYDIIYLAINLVLPDPVCMPLVESLRTECEKSKVKFTLMPEAFLSLPPDEVGVLGWVKKGINKIRQIEWKRPREGGPR